MSEDIIEKTEILLQSIGIPSQPRVIMDINKEIDKEAPDFRVIANLISRDVAMSAKILKVCNSPFFGLRQKADNIGMALNVLGLRNFKNVVFASALRDSMNNRNIPEKDFEAFCDHSLFVAKIAQNIVLRLSREIKSHMDPNHAYMCGLFHDCAIPLLTNKFKDYFPQMIDGMKAHGAMIPLEEKLFHSNHCIAGYFVAKSWHLPMNLCIAIQNHHAQDISIVEDLDARRLLSVLMLAESIIYFRDKNLTDAFEIFNQHVADENLDRILFELDLNRDDVSDIEDSVDEILERASGA